MTPDLSGLKDIHMVAEPSWWPPAVGWWLVLAGIVGFILLTGILYAVWYHRPRQYALRALETLYRTTENPVVLARHMSALLKRIALTLYPRRAVAGLSAEDWQAFLIEQTQNAFSAEQAKLLAFSTYLPDNTLVPVSRDGLYRAGQAGIKVLFKGKKHGN